MARHGHDLWLALSTSSGSSGLIRWDIFAPQKLSQESGCFPHQIGERSSVGTLQRQPALGNHTAPSRLHCLKSGGQLMDTAAEFRKYAAECNRTAKVSKDPETKALWCRMEERWLLCAKLVEEDDQSAARIRARRVASKRHINGTLHHRN